MKVALNDPDPSEATVVGDVVCKVPSYFTVIVEDARKLVPDTVTAFPTLPDDGLSETEGAEETACRVGLSDIDTDSVRETAALTPISVWVIVMKENRVTNFRRVLPNVWVTVTRELRVLLMILATVAVRD